MDFRNTVLIMTSNLRTEDELKGTFRPEFINRIDETLEFHPLEEKHLATIAAIQFGLLGKRLAGRGIQLALTDEACAVLARRGYDPLYGARPLKRLMQREIENPLARRILSGEFGDGDKVTVDAHEGAFTFRRG